MSKEGFEGETCLGSDACVCRYEGDVTLCLNVLKIDSGSKLTETWCSGRSGTMSILDDKTFLKLRYFLFECEKNNSKSNLFSGKELVLKTGVSSNYSIDGVAIISGKEVIAGFN